MRSMSLRRSRVTGPKARCYAKHVAAAKPRYWAEGP